MVILFIYTSIIVVCLLSIQVFQLLPNRNSFDQVVFAFVITVLIHVCFAATFRDLVKGYQFVDRGAPFGLLYGPLLYFAFLASTGRRIPFSTIFIHLIPFFLFLGLFFYFLISDSFRLDYGKIFYYALYSLFGISWLIYPISLLFKGGGMEKSMLNIKKLFYYSVILLLVLAAFIIPLILSQFLNQEGGGSPISGYTIFFIMLLGATLAYNYFIRELSIRAKSSSNFYSLESKSKSEEQLDVKNELPISSRHFLYEEKILTYLELETYLDPDFNVDMMLRDLKMSRGVLSQFFKEYFNQNVLKTINSLRIKAVCKALEQEDFDMNIEELALRCGFSSRASFYRNFSQEMDCSPVEYRERVLKHIN